MGFNQLSHLNEIVFYSRKQDDGLRECEPVYRRDVSISTPSRKRKIIPGPRPRTDGTDGYGHVYDSWRTSNRINKTWLLNEFQSGRLTAHCSINLINSHY